MAGTRLAGEKVGPRAQGCLCAAIFRCYGGGAGDDDDDEDGDVEEEEEEEEHKDEDEGDKDEDEDDGRIRRSWRKGGE